MEEALVAPCGMDCGLCAAFLAMKSGLKSRGIRVPYCAGCRPRGKQCAYLKKYCGRLGEGGLQYCYECGDFPCRHLQGIDKRYRVRYRVSLTENLEYIKEHGIEAFLQQETQRWRCPECGGVICCHNGICFSCGLDKLRSRPNLYRWEDIGNG